MLIEKWCDHDIPLYICFMDYAKAFDCVSHKMLWHIMTEMGFPSHSLSNQKPVLTTGSYGKNSRRADRLVYHWKRSQAKVPDVTHPV